MTSLLFLRLAVGATWLYHGLHLKLISRIGDPFTILGVGANGSTLGATGLTLIGVGETLLGLFVLIGLWMRWLAGAQIAGIIILIALAIFQGGAAPIRTVVDALPILACLSVLATQGAGRWHV